MRQGRHLVWTYFLEGFIIEDALIFDGDFAFGNDASKPFLRMRRR